MAESSVFLNEILKVEQELLDLGPEVDFPAKAKKVVENQGSFSFTGFESLHMFLNPANPIPQYYGPHGFGKFNLTLVNNGAFFIIAMFMDDLGTEIHDHPFIGSFTSLKGNPYEISYEFKEHHSLADDLKAGELVTTAVRQVKVCEPVAITENSIHLLSRPAGGQWSMLVGRLLPQEQRQNHYYYHPGLKVRNQKSFAELQRIVTYLNFSNIDADSFLSSFTLGEVLYMYKYSRYGNRAAVHNRLKLFLKNHHNNAWEYIESNDKYMANLKRKLSIQT